MTSIATSPFRNRPPLRDSVKPQHRNVIDPETKALSQYNFRQRFLQQIRETPESTVSLDNLNSSLERRIRQNYQNIGLSTVQSLASEDAGLASLRKRKADLSKALTVLTVLPFAGLAGRLGVRKLRRIANLRGLLKEAYSGRVPFPVKFSISESRLKSKLLEAAKHGLIPEEKVLNISIASVGEEAAKDPELILKALEEKTGIPSHELAKSLAKGGQGEYIQFLQNASPEDAAQIVRAMVAREFGSSAKLSDTLERQLREIEKRGASEDVLAMIRSGISLPKALKEVTKERGAPYSEFLNQAVRMYEGLPPDQRKKTSPLLIAKELQQAEEKRLLKGAMKRGRKRGRRRKNNSEDESDIEL